MEASVHLGIRPSSCFGQLLLGGNGICSLITAGCS